MLGEGIDYVDRKSPYLSNIYACYSNSAASLLCIVMHKANKFHILTFYSDSIASKKPLGHIYLCGAEAVPPSLSGLCLCAKEPRIPLSMNPINNFGLISQKS